MVALLGASPEGESGQWGDLFLTVPWSWQDLPSFQGKGECPGVRLLGTVPVATQVPLLEEGGGRL